MINFVIFQVNDKILILNNVFSQTKKKQINYIEMIIHVIIMLLIYHRCVVGQYVIVNKWIILLFYKKIYH